MTVDSFEPTEAVVDLSSDVISPWGSPRQRAAQRRNKRDALLATAAKLFKAQGFASTSLDQMAVQLGITKPTLYYYVRSKSELVQACALQGWAHALQAVQAAVTTDQPERWVQVLKAYAQALSTDFGWCMVRVSEYAQVPAMRKAIAQQRTAVEECVASVAATALPVAVILRALEGVVLALPKAQWRHALDVLAATPKPTSPSPCVKEPAQVPHAPAAAVASPLALESAQPVAMETAEPEPEPELISFNSLGNQSIAMEIPTHQQPETRVVDRLKKKRSKPEKALEQISLF